MDLQDLYLNKDIDQFAMHICKQNNLLNLESILEYFQINNGFLGLDYCSKEENQKLMLLCSKYSSFSAPHDQFINPEQEKSTKEKKRIPNYTLEQLAEIEDLGIRSQNACKYFNLDTLKDIIYYYKKNGDFLKVRNCGRKSNDELIKVCNKYEGFFIDELTTQIEEENKNPIVTKIEELKVRQKKIVNNLIISSFNDLSVRSSNALKNYLEGNINLKGFKSLFSEKNLKLTNLKNVGKKSIEEIQTFLNLIIEQIEIVSVFENEDELTIELFNSFLTRTFGVSPAILSKIGNEYDFSNGLPIFKTLDVLINGDFLFDAKEKEVFRKGFLYNNSNEILSLEEISKNLNLSRERVRQIRKIIYDNLNSTFSFINFLENDSINLYGIDVNSDMIILDDEIISEINTKENNSFNALFVNKILSIILDKTFTLIGNEENTVTQRIIRTAHNWKSSYLVKLKIANSFNFESFINDVSKRLTDRIDEDYAFHFETYLLNFQIENLDEGQDVIIEICEHLLFNEFEVSLDANENIVFKRNTKKQVHEYSYEALEQLGEPSKVQKIYEKVKERYPDFNTNPSKIRASMKQNNGFVPFGRTSVFGLKKWEEEQDIRGGTIRDISEEFLLMQKEPQHIDKIAEYVNQYRDTNAKNIYANLKMEENSRFVFFSGLLIGLKSKTYINTDYTKVEDKQVIRKTWEESFQLLEEFTQKNNRLPFSTGSELEERLYRFLIVQFNRASKGKVEESKLRKLTQLCEKFGFKKGKRRNSKSTDESYTELKEFLLKERRLPSATNEAKLYRFLYTQGKLFKNDSLSKEYQDKYLAVKKIIKEIL